MQHNPEIEAIVELSVKIARDLRHEYVTTEHLLLAMLRHPPFRKTLNGFGVEVDQMDTEIELYLISLVSLHSKSQDVQPKKTTALERLFNRANVQVMFTGRRSMSTIDIYLSIMSEGNSHAHYFLLKYGVKKQEFIDYWQKHYKAASVSESGMSADQAKIGRAHV